MTAEPPWSPVPAAAAPPAAAERARWLVERMGPHPARRAGLEPAERSGDLGRWWSLCVLLDPRAGGGEERGLRAWRSLEADGLAAPERLAEALPAALAGRLEAAGLGRAERAAAELARGARRLAEGASPDEALRALAGAEDAETLGRALRARAGLGRAAALRFLVPLRSAWPAAAELPLGPAARAAGIHLGWLDEWAEAGLEAASLATLLRRDGEPPPLADVEAALERLGRAACRAGRTARCPLAGACPARA